MIPRFLLPAVAAVCLWQLVRVTGLVAPAMLASPWEVALGFRDLCTVGMPPGRLLPVHVWYSLLRVLLGVTLAVVLGVPLGLTLGASRRIRLMVMPLIDFLRPIPPLAWVPLAILWFGLGLTSAAYLIFLGAVFPIVLSTCAGVRGVDHFLVEAVSMLGASRLTIWRKVLLPAAMPSICTGIRIGVGIGWMTLVAAEFTGVRGGYGLGYMIMSARDLQRGDLVIAGMAAIGLLGLGIEWIMGRLSNRMLRWQ
jgi:ABC-type nitrate/sulfonate/bicarbonate transport system permease component